MIAHEYTPRSMAELAPAPTPPRELVLEKPPPSKPVFQDWRFKSPEAYNAFASSHAATKWVEVLMPGGEHVAWGLTIDAITQLAEKVRKKKDDFEFMSRYPGGRVIGIHIGGKKLPSVEAVGDLYFPSRAAAFDGTADMLVECEIYAMEGRRFGRKPLGHSQALLRWRELKTPFRLVPRGPVIVPVVVPVAEIETLPGHRFQGLRVRGDTAMQTILPEDLADTPRRAALDAEFASFDPVADDVNATPAGFADITYPQQVSALKRLIARKRDIATGKEAPDELDAINARIAAIEEKLEAQGVRLDENQIIDKLDQGRDLKEFTGRLLIDPPAAEGTPHYFGQRLTARMALDYVPPGASVKVKWVFRPGPRPDDPYLPRPTPGEEYEIGYGDRDARAELGPAFWGQIGVLPPIVERAQKIKIAARVWLNDDEAAALSYESDWIDFGKGGYEPPPTLHITGPKIVVAGDTALFAIMEWSPLQSHHYYLWTEDGTRYAARESADLPYYSVSVGMHRLGLQVHPSYGDTSKVIREAAPFEVEVQDPKVAGANLLAAMDKQDKPSLADVVTTTRTSLDEIRKRVDQGGAGEAYWKRRLESQEKRLDKLDELAPGAGQSTPLPADPTRLDEAMAYSGPISAALVVPGGGGAQAMSVYLTARRQGEGWTVRLLDLTSSDILKFEGTGATTLEAYHSVFRAWRDDNPYPRGGRLVHSFKPPGWTGGDGFDTNRWDKTAKAWVDGIAVVVAGLLLLVPEPTGLTKLIGGIILVATTVKAGVTIYENVKMGMDILDSRNVFEGISILTTFLGVSGTVLRGVGISAVRPVVYHVGSYLVLSALAIEGATLVYATGAAVAEMRAIAADPTKDEGQKSAEILSVMSRLMAQGVIFFVANKEMFKGGLKKSDFVSTGGRRARGTTVALG